MLHGKEWLLIAAVVGTSSLIAQAADMKTEMRKGGVEKVIYHVSDSANARLAMINAKNHLAASNGHAQIVVVTNSKGVDFLLEDAKDSDGNLYQPTVQELKARGVDFRLCKNTLVSRKIEQMSVIPEAQIIPSGVAEIGKLQTYEGYVYLKP